MIWIFIDDEADSQTEGEELERAREARRQEFKLKPVQYLPTDTETEVSTRFWIIINLGNPVAHELFFDHSKHLR